jgi:ribonucleoside-diphosphate reductase alpha chain
VSDGKRLASDIKFYTDYSKFVPKWNRLEDWQDAVERVMDMHRHKYAKQIEENPELERAIDFAEQAYKNKQILGSQRALQWADGPNAGILKHEMRMYNCLGSYADRIEFFQEAFYLLLCGCGTGFSVQHHHVEHIPPISPRDGEAKTFVVLDNIEGWADAAGALISSYIHSNFDTPFPHYQGHHIAFDFTQIRPKGAMISGGFKAPGPDGLRESLAKIEQLLTGLLRGQDHYHLRPINVYDIVMHLADAVLSGGVRRSATICLFDPDDEEMVRAKTGNWFEDNPQRARSNNSAILVRDKVTKEQFAKFFEFVHQYGEPGFFFTEDEGIITNPCAEIGFWPQTEDGESGWQGCNLTEINGGYCSTPVKFYEACRAAAIMGTLQAGYTDFKYVDNTTREIFEREALLGVSVTGWTNNPEVLFDTDIMIEGAEIVKITNKIIAKMLEIRPAARTTCVKPSGNASVLLGTASGIHGEHAPQYFRNMQMNKDDDVAQVFQKYNPIAVEESVWSSNSTDWVFSIPIKAPEHSLFKRHLIGINQLELVRLVQNNWVEHGTDEELCVNPVTRHNVSNTIQVEDWEEVRDYIYDNRRDFAGVSLLGIAGDKAYAQAPFTEIFSREVLMNWYGDAALFASGLIVDGLHAFNDNLWKACDAALYDRDVDKVLQKDWKRIAVKFAANYFENDIGMMTHCLKDVYNYHKWVKINQTLVDINWEDEPLTPNYIDVDTLASAACIGGVCEI